MSPERPVADISAIRKIAIQEAEARKNFLAKRAEVDFSIMRDPKTHAEFKLMMNAALMDAPMDEHTRQLMTRAVRNIMAAQRLAGRRLTWTNGPADASPPTGE